MTLLGLATIAALGFVVRLAGTGERTLFWDEAYHIRLANAPSVVGMLGSVLANPPSDPLYAFLLRGWVAFAGNADFAVRLPSVALGALTVIATGWLAWEMTAARRIVIAAALVAAVAPYLVEFGQEASLYALAAPATTFALAAGWRWRRTARRCDAALALGLAVIASYSHYVVPAILGLAAILSMTRLAGPAAVSRLQVALMSAAVVAAWLPWLLPMLASWMTAETPRSSLQVRAGFAEFLGGLSQYTSGSGALLNRVRPLQLLGVAIAGLLILRAWWDANGLRRGLRVIIVVSGLIMAGPWLASFLTGRWLFVAHMMLFLLPALSVVITAGALAAEGGSRLTRAAAATAGIVFVAVQLGGLTVNLLDPPHGDDGSRDVAQALESIHERTDPVLILPNEQQLIFDRYWSGPLDGLPRDVDIRMLYRPVEVAADLAATVERFDLIAGTAARAWLVYTPAREADALFLDWLRHERVVTLVVERPFGALYEIRKASAVP